MELARKANEEEEQLRQQEQLDAGSLVPETPVQGSPSDDEPFRVDPNPTPPAPEQPEQPAPEVAMSVAKSKASLTERP